LAEAALVLRAKIGWSWVGYLIGVSIVAISLVVLFQILRNIEINKVAAAFREVPLTRLAVAAGFVAAAYGTLTFYDLFALRTIGIRHIPYRTAAFVSFTAYSIGHNVGATAFSAGAIRYRIYAGWGLGVTDVAKICFLTGLTFWLGNLTVLGLGMTYDPQPVGAVNQLPVWINRAIGITLLCGLGGYLVWAFREPRWIGRQNWRLALPSGRSTLLQIAIGVADMTFCSLAMYTLIPSTPPIDFMTLAVVFVAATLLGFASHAPGSLGVFDAAMLVGLSQFDTEALLAGLLLFRILYFIVPFACGLLLMAIRETKSTLGRAEQARD
jgi:uncharacterized membrane protein YbhN (UPF0104 family)